jgi:anti-sigma regulatory factor (Ser/Thr protein kinase)
VPLPYPFNMSTLAYSHPSPAMSSTRWARLAVYHEPTEPPTVAEIACDDPGTLIERLFEAVARWARLPIVAIREIIENLVHADFRDALVSVLANGHVVRVSDSGPGIDDPGQAMRPGFTTAGADERSIIRGVGCGLPLAASVMDAEGGTIEFARNLGGGTVVTLTTPNQTIEDDSENAAMPAEDDRLVMALLLEMGPSLPEHVAAELSWTVGRCGRELVVLESRGLVSRDSDGRRSLTPNGSRLLSTLF